MKYPRRETSVCLIITFIALYSVHCSSGRAEQPRAYKPPMGWNSFDSYGVYLHEEAAMANIAAMAKKLKPYGYEYFVVDNGWFGEYALQEGTIFPAEKHAHDIQINEYGHFLPSKVYFPNGFEPLVEHCREHDLKFGVHLMRGIPRKAVELNLPIKGTPYTARDIAITDPDLNCQWCTYCYGVDMDHPGGQAWYDGLIKHIAGMGVVFIKYDDIVPYPKEVEGVARAVKSIGEPIILSLSPGGTVDPNAIESFRMANMLRVTNDIWDEQKDIDACFDAWRKWQGKEQPGFWIDMDMIPFGQLQVMSPPSTDESKAVMDKGDIALAGKGVHRWSQLSKAQKRTFITMRAMAASPLMMGGDLPTLDDHSLSLITNSDMLACNQNGVMGSLVFEKNGLEIWKVEEKEEATGTGEADTGWIGVFNRTDGNEPTEINKGQLGLETGKKYDLHDVWGESSFKPGTIEIEPHNCLFLRYTEEK